MAATVGGTCGRWQVVGLQMAIYENVTTNANSSHNIHNKDHTSIPWKSINRISKLSKPSNRRKKN